MGVLETKRVIQPPKRRRMTKRKRMFIMCAKIAGLAAAVLALITVIYLVGFAEYTYINLSELTQASVSGYNGHGTLSTTTAPMAGLEEFFDTVSVTVLDTDEIKNGTLSNGDKIEIEYSYNKEMAKENKLRVRGGSEFVSIKDLPDGKPITFDEHCKGVKLEDEGVDRYLTDASELPQEFLDQMKEYGATLFGTEQGDANEYGVRLFTAAGTMYSTSGGDYTFAWRTPSYISSYFTCINDEHLGDPGNQVNDVKVVYDTAVVQADGKSVSAEAVVSFKDIVKKADGTIAVDLESGEIVSASTNDSDIKALVRATGDELYTSTKLEQ
jgi:hypothetical protein